MSYKGKVVWITGASSGVGEGFAYAYAKKGAKLILSARRVDALNRVKTNCEGAAEVIVLPLDLSDHSSIPQKVKQVIDKYGKVDLLINNGGISQRALTQETSLEVDKRLMDINYFGTIALTKALLPSMLIHDLGQIVTITSLTGKFGVPYRSAYAASKHALHGFFDTLRIELSETNLKITLLCPGFIQTELAESALKGDGNPTARKDPNIEKGMTVKHFVKRAIKAIKKGQKEAYFGRESLGVYVHRFFPSLFARIVKKQL